MKNQGRPRSIPERLFVRVHAMHRTGLGYQAIAAELSRLGIATSRGSVERLVKGLPPYDGTQGAHAVASGLEAAAELVTLMDRVGPRSGPRG